MRHDLYPGQTRLYVVVGTLIGTTVGFLMHSFLLAELTRGPNLIAWLAVFSGMGGVVGRLLVVAQSREAGPRESQDVRAAEDSGVQEPVSDEKFYSLQTGAYSSSQLRTMRVRAFTAPMAPPDLDVRLLVEEYDHAVRVPVLEGVLEKLTAAELRDRARAEAERRAPRTLEDTRLRLVAYGSEGPLQADGRCVLGWWFVFVDGPHGLLCTAVATAREISLMYRTVSTYYAPERDVWIEPADALAAALRAVPELEDLGPRLKINLPDDCLVFAGEPPVIAEIDAERLEVRNPEGLRAALAIHRTSDRPEAFPLDALGAWSRGETVTHEGAARALADSAFADGMRTLERAALGRAARALYAHHGPGITEQLAQAAAIGDDREERIELIYLLAQVPSGLATVALQRLAGTLEDATVKGKAEELFLARRRGDLGVPDDALDPLSFLEIRERMGKRPFRFVPLRSTYDPERELLEPLARIGLMPTRRRLLSGDAPLLVAAHLRPAEGETEAVLLATPVPVPCQVMHFVGPEADALAARVRAADLEYAEADILADASSGKMTRLHKAALYIAALRIDAADAVEPLIEGLRRARHDGNLVRAVLLALEVQQSDRADAFLRECAASTTEPGEAREIAAEILARRAHASAL